MMIRTSLSPSDVTPAAYLLPSAISLSRRAATRGSTTPIRIAVAERDEPVALGGQLDRVARVDLGELARVGAGRSGTRSRSCRSPRRRSLTGRLAALLGRDGLLAGRDEQHLEPVDVALGDPVRRIEGERRLVVLAGRAELAELPERLGQPVLGLGVRARARAGGGSSSAASAHWAAVAWAMAWSASWRFWRVRLTGLWCLVSTSGKVTVGRSPCCARAHRDGRDRGARIPEGGMAL